jgi:hypothetical protein
LAVEKWDVETGKRTPFPMEPMDAFRTLIGRLIFVSSERTLCIQCAEGDGGKAVGIDLSSGKIKYSLSQALARPSISPDGRTGAAIDSMDATPVPFPVRVAFWNFDDGTKLRKLTLRGGKDLPVEIPTLPDPVAFARSDAPGGKDLAVGAFTGDSRFFVVAAGDENRNIRVIDAKKAEVRSSFTVDGRVKGLFLLDSGEIAAVGIEPKAIVIWKIKTP